MELILVIRKCEIWDSDEGGEYLREAQQIIGICTSYEQTANVIAEDKRLGFSYRKVSYATVPVQAGKFYYNLGEYGE